MSRLPVLAVLGIAAAIPAQVEWQVENPRGRAMAECGRLVPVLPRKVVETTAGRARVHFPIDADGKPTSLEFEVRDGDRVVIGANDFVAPVAQSVQLPVADGFEGELTNKGRATPLQIRTTGKQHFDATDYRVEMTVQSQQNGTFGIVARHHEESGCYLFSIDWASRVLRLERWMGADHVVINKQQLSVEWGGEHRFALQVDGFRLRAFLDDAMVLQSFDGALRRGSIGVAWDGERPEFRDVTMAEPAEARESVAIVQRRGEAIIHATSMVPPGNYYVLQLTLDRPHRPIPLSPAGLEPWLRQPPAAPIVLLADWRNRFASGGLGEVPVEGKWSIPLRWNTQPAMVNQVVLARVLMVSGNGEAVIGATPPVRVVF